MNYQIPEVEQTQIWAEIDKAVQRGMDHANPEWRRMAIQTIYDFCLTRETFTANEFSAVILQSEIKTHDNRAIAGVVAKARKMKWIERTGVKVGSKAGHLSQVEVWRSLIVGRAGSNPEAAEPATKQGRLL